MPRVVWDQDAEQDLRDIAHYIGVECQSPQGARNLLRAIREKCELYAAQPELGTACPDLAPDLRIFSCGTQSNPRRYVVLYLPAGDGIQVVRVFEGHRDYPALFR
ncbi:MAG: type II toxin-antitoxin system RelE/ParE family toxin [Planctomycetes bacterium]|nr:type II toxin-antitoxin system RelE/ParE family toxin [Planctomycetota bacterium]